MKRTLSVLLVCLTILPLLAACGGADADVVPENTRLIETAAETAAETTADRSAVDDLPELDYDGSSFHVRSVTYDPQSYLTLFDLEEQSGDVVQDALYMRNRIIEERLNIVFVSSEDTYTENYKMLNSVALAGDSSFDLIQCINRESFAAALKGYILTVNKLPYLDLIKSYYAHDVNEQMSIGGVLFFAYSDECVHMFETTMMFMFNKDLISDFGLASPYELTDSGKWTFAVMQEYALTAAADLDGDGVMNQTADRYGLLSSLDFYFPTFWIAAGENSIEKDRDDIPYFNALGNERFTNALEFSISMKAAEGAVWLNNDRPLTVKKFMEGGGLFCLTTVGRMNLAREMESDFGIVPFPKYDEAQDRYYNRVIDGWLHVVPISCADGERASAVMEALAYETSVTVIPSYYGKAVQQKMLRDEESIEMLELIRRSRVMDLGDVPWMDNVRNIYVSAVQNGQSTVASLTESKSSSVQAKIDEAVEAAKNLQ